MRPKLKSAALPVAELKRRVPDLAVVARDLYQVEFRKDIAHCPFPENHSHGDRDPSLRFDKRKNRLFCASQNCFGEKGVDAIGLVRRMERCSFHEGVQKLADHYGIQNGGDKQDSRRPRIASGSGDQAGKDENKEPIPAEKVRQSLSRGGFRAVAEFEYGTSLRKVRFEQESARQTDKDRVEKTFRWEHFVHGSWYSGDGDLPKPLYVNQTFRERDQVSLAMGFEGEAKAISPATSVWPRFPSRTLHWNSPPHWRAATRTLARQRFERKEQADAAARVICNSAQARSIKLLAPPAEFPPTADIIDAVKDLWMGS